MKKVLIASTALVAATMFSGAASASEKIKLELGGFSKWWVVGQWQEGSFQSNNNARGAQGDYNSVDIKGDNEIFFGGSTTLDNGMKVGINIELEAGGNTGTNAASTNGNDSADIIDKSSVFVESGFGKVILGSEANGAALLHVFAPDAAGNTDSDGIITGGYSIVRPNAVNRRVSTSIDTDDNAEKITYVAPSFYGLTVGATYVPNTSEDIRSSARLNTASNVAGEIYGVGALYAKTFGGVDLKVSAGWATYDAEAGLMQPTKVNEYTAGTQIGYAGFTVGGSYRKVNAANILAPNGFGAGDVWDMGVQYASGPYAVSFVYFQSIQQATVGGGDDRFSVYQASGKYSLGAGVDALATVGRGKYAGTSGLDQDQNTGWSAMTGLSLAF
ncbi:MAG: porin [Bacteroidales bacterium]